MSLNIWIPINKMEVKMKKAVLISTFLMFLTVLSVSSFAGPMGAVPYNPLNSLRIYATSSLYSPPSDKATGSSIMYGVGLEYRLGSDWAVNGEYDTTSYQRELGTETITPMSLSVKRYFNGIPFMSAYMGAGLNSTTTSYNGDSFNTTGYQAMVGCGLGLVGAGINFEAKYQVLDSTKANEGAWSLGASISGSTTMFF
jgi:hypothetical protein